MLKLYKNVLSAPVGTDVEVVILNYDDRKRSRMRVTLESGIEVGIFLTRGEQLRDGDLLQSEDGQRWVSVRAAPEPLIEYRAISRESLARAAYHLGNRHVPVQIMENGIPPGGSLRLQRDHVLASMLAGMGGEVTELIAPFQPESGAYKAGASPSHSHHHPHPEPPNQDGHSHSEAFHPGHGDHRKVPKIHQF